MNNLGRWFRSLQLREMRRLWNRTGLTVPLLCVAGLCVSCAQSGSNGARSAPGVNITNLIAECEVLAHEGASKGQMTWTSHDPLTTTIKSLSPQLVTVTTQAEATLVNIQVSGGFRHRGYLVVCTSRNRDFVPVTGRHNWRIAKVAPRVFEYRE